ncbi:MAG: bifunctional 3-deoxy-7-phosphoheptulonate synthase/chorismate mutase type II [Bacteroidota bacterium]|nr:bifunctional 3-deoxy-7-phosphoheptulonate synthase/chorismate mutase type II [Bacteroidota bacterium]
MHTNGSEVLETSLFVKKDNRPFLIAGPCSAETEEQVLCAAYALADAKIDLFRSGIWKPRTRPGVFEGRGSVALPWLKRVKEETGLRTTVEVANAKQVDKALAFGIDVLWIGARSTANPFSVQEIADAIKGVDIPIMVKNPTNPDLELWIGAIERVQAAGISKIAAIHRGFSSYAKSMYRNEPYWQIPIELRRRMPGIPILCDNSHISGNRSELFNVAQYALDLNYDGLMTETHCDPDNALSDAFQQITPATYKLLIDKLEFKREMIDDSDFVEYMDSIRHEIDELDLKVLDLLSKRMKLSEEIGKHKKYNRISILQLRRWNDIMEKAKDVGKERGLSEGFISNYLNAVHQESIARQSGIRADE